MHELLSDFYAGNPDGVVNDRWGDTHWDFRTSEYESGTDVEVAGQQWEQCRGIGLSFGYNQVEGPDQYLDGRALSRLLGDIVSRGGRLLLNVGPTAAGEIIQPQQDALRGLGRWMRTAGEHLAASVPVDERVARPQRRAVGALARDAGAPNGTGGPGGDHPAGLPVSRDRRCGRGDGPGCHGRVERRRDPARYHERSRGRSSRRAVAQGQQLIPSRAPVAGAVSAPPADAVTGAVGGGEAEVAVGPCWTVRNRT